MFIHVDPLFKVLTRHAESTDTREDIKRKDPDQERGKQKNKHEEHQNSALWDDETDVSIEALTSFLQNLLGNKNHIFNNNAEPEKTEKLNAPENAPASYAINAYQKRSGESKKIIHISEPSSNSESDVTLSEKDIPLVEALLDDLVELKKRNVEYLIISRQGTFFNSVKDAIQDAHDTQSL